MSFTSPHLLWLALPALAVLLWIDARSTHPMPARRRRALFLVRASGVLLLIAAAAGPSLLRRSGGSAVAFIIDQSESMGADGAAAAWNHATARSERLPSDTPVAYVTAGADARVIRGLSTDKSTSTPPALELDAQTNLDSAVRLAAALLPNDSGRHIVLISDGQETRGSLEWAARDALLNGTRIHALPVAGPARPDARVLALEARPATLSAGATAALTAQIDSSVAGTGILRLFENGLEIERREIALANTGEQRVEFQRSPPRAGAFRYRVSLERVAGDSLSTNNEALAIVDVRGQPIILYVEGEEAEARHLAAAMKREGLQLEIKSPAAMPKTLPELASYDGVIVSDVTAQQLGDSTMQALRDYVGKLGGGFVMLGGRHSFGLGGYVRTPIEDLLPVRLSGQDEEEQQSVALALVLDRSGSMSGEKLTLCKSAAIATAELLTRQDSIGIYAFDSEPQVIAAMARVTSSAPLQSQIASLAAGGGTNMKPALELARSQLNGAAARIKHIITLTDGQTDGEGYEALAAQCFSDGITISTVAIGTDTAATLLQAIARAGGGQFYETADPAALVRIFTQDTLLHAGRILREEPFQAKLVERHPMLAGWDQSFAAPPLLGYLKTVRKASAQVPLVTEAGDPLLATWRYELGKATAFASDAKSRWSQFWIKDWPEYPRFWAQVLRETIRPPQSQLLDLELTRSGDSVEIEATLLEDAGAFAQDASVQADILLSAGQGADPPQAISHETLRLAGPGRYVGRFTPTTPGVYLIQASAGSRAASASWVFDPQREAVTGRINEPLLRNAVAMTGGAWLEGESSPAPLLDSSAAPPRRVELWPLLTKIFLLVLIVDVLLRRWDHIAVLFQRK